MAIPTSQPRMSGLRKWLSLARRRLERSDRASAAWKTQNDNRSRSSILTTEGMQFSHLHKADDPPKNTSTSRMRQLVHLDSCARIICRRVRNEVVERTWRGGRIKLSQGTRSRPSRNSNTRRHKAALTFDPSLRADSVQLTASLTESIRHPSKG